MTRLEEFKKKNKKRGFNWRIWVASLLFIIAGVLFAAGPIRSYMLAQFQQEHAVQLSKVTAAEVKENETQEAEFDFSTVEPLDLQAVVKAKMDTSKFLTLGAIAVPSVKLNLPIYKGISNPVLLAGAGTLKPTQKMGEGNYALASHHYFSDERLLFSPLIKLKVGDKIYLTDMEYVYEYETTSIDLVEAYQVEVIYDVPGKTEITLITCDDLQASHRYSFKGKFISKTPISDVTEDVKQAFNIDFTTL